MREVLKEIKDTVRSDVVVVACSTGPDSMALLRLCMDALDKKQIIIAHINHHVREESEEEEKFIRDFALKNKLILEVGSYSFDERNFENNARIARYSFFSKVANKYQAKYIMLAHHANDNLETMIMRFLKSSSLKGYAGIEKISSFHDLLLFRPLLSKSKKEIIHYAEKLHLKYFIDRTNYEDDHTRNRIRKYIIPLLEEENPNLIEAVNYYNQSLLGASNLLKDTVVRFQNQFVKIIEEDIIIQIEALKKEKEYLQKEILFDTLKKYDLSIKNLDQIFKILNSPKTNIHAVVTKNLNVIKEQGNLIFTKKAIEETPFFLKIEEEGTYNLPNLTKIIVSKNNCTFLDNETKICYNIKKLPIVIRLRKKGDTIVRTNQKNTAAPNVYTQKVSDILTNKKVPYLKRLHTYVLCEDEHVTAILGYKLK